MKTLKMSLVLFSLILSPVCGAGLIEPARAKSPSTTRREIWLQTNSDSDVMLVAPKLQLLGSGERRLGFRLADPNTEQQRFLLLVDPVFQEYSSFALGSRSLEQASIRDPLELSQVIQRFPRTDLSRWPQRTADRVGSVVGDWDGRLLPLGLWSIVWSEARTEESKSESSTATEKCSLERRVEVQSLDSNLHPTATTSIELRYGSGTGNHQPRGGFCWASSQSLQEGRWLVDQCVSMSLGDGLSNSPELRVGSYLLSTADHKQVDRITQLVGFSDQSRAFPSDALVFHSDWADQDSLILLLVSQYQTDPCGD